MDEDFSLLQQYVRERSDAAFETLMKRYVDLVYSSSLRLTGDLHQAEDVTQAVFIVLSKKAAQLKPNVVLPAWLLTVTKLTAGNSRRDKSNQSRIEQKAASMNAHTASAPSESVDWSQISPLLDDAIAGLSDIDRAAVVLRYFSHCSSPDIAKRLNISTDAAEKRVSRGVEKLRQFFASRGVAISAVVLAGQLTGNSVQAAPAALVSALPHAIAAGTASAASAGVTSSAILAKGALHAMSVITVKHIALYTCATLIVGLAGTAVIRSAGAAPTASSGEVGSAPIAAPAQSSAAITAAPLTASLSEPVTDAPKPSEVPAANSVTPRASGTGSVKGTVKFKGKPPEPAVIPIPPSQHPDCKHKPIPNDDLIVDKQTMGIKDAIIRILDVKAPPQKEPLTDVSLDQKDCRFTPHALIIPPGANLNILNPDGAAHNVHTTPLDGLNNPINKMMLSVDPKMELKGSKYLVEPEIIKIQCDIHPWMNAWLVVHDPRFAFVTGKDGSFEIKDVPPGKYKLSVFHTLGEQILEIEVKAGEHTHVGDVEFGQK